MKTDLVGESASVARGLVRPDVDVRELRDTLALEPSEPGPEKLRSGVMLLPLPESLFSTEKLRDMRVMSLSPRR